MHVVAHVDVHHLCNVEMHRCTSYGNVHHEMHVGTNVILHILRLFVAQMCMFNMHCHMCNIASLHAQHARHRNFTCTSCAKKIPQMRKLCMCKSYNKCTKHAHFEFILLVHHAQPKMHILCAFKMHHHMCINSFSNSLLFLPSQI